MSTMDSCLWGCKNFNNSKKECTFTVSGQIECNNIPWKGLDNKGQLVNIPGVCFNNCYGQNELFDTRQRFEQKILVPGNDSGKFTKFIMRDMF